MLTVIVVLAVLAFWVVAALVAGTVLPRLRAVRERQQVADEVRFAQWRLQQATNAAVQRLLDEARRRP